MHEITLVIYPVQDILKVGELWNAAIAEGDIMSEEIGYGETPSDAVDHLIKLIAEDMDEIVIAESGG